MRVLVSWLLLLAAGCSSSSLPTCTDGDLRLCACAGGAVGTQSCADGSYGACACDDRQSPPTTGCVPGMTAACVCPTGATGAQACGSDATYGPCACAEPYACVPGISIACVCSDGRTGAQVCGADGTFGVCSCMEAMPDAGADLTQVFPPEGGVYDLSTLQEDLAGPIDLASPMCAEASPPASPTLTPPAAGKLVDGTGKLIDFFVTATGIVVVTSTAAILESRSGTELQRWTSTREIRSAAFDGERLVIADRAAINWLDLSLALQKTIFTAEECATGVLLSCARFVCGPANDVDRRLYTYDLQTGQELARSQPYTYDGIPMKRVPGTSAFLTVTTNLSPSDYHYYRVDGDGTAVYTTDSPYHGAFAIKDTYAFRGVPATHVVNIDGRFLTLANCATATTYPSNGCLAQDGALGTLATNESFYAMETGGDGRLYAVAGPSSMPYGAAVCSTGCRVQRIDMTAHTITSEAALPATTIQQNLRLRHDAWAGRVIVAGDANCGTYYPYSCGGWSMWIAGY